MTSGRSLTTAAAGLALSITALAHAAVIYVDHAATGGNTGNNWANAYTSLTVAFAAAADGDEVWIAEGRYTPPSTSWWDIDVTIDIHGGFVSGATDIDDRNPLVNKTILDADINEDDGPDHTNKADNAPGILKMGAYNNVLGDVTLSGLNIKNSGSRPGLIIDANSLDVDTCRFAGNLDVKDADFKTSGAAIRMDGVQLRILDSVFVNNKVEVTDPLGERAFGGAVNLGGEVEQVVIRRTEFRDNAIDSATGAVGGALYLRAGGLIGGTAEITDCEFIGNSAIGEGSDASGGVVYLFSAANTVIRDCLFESNTIAGVTDIEGGALAIRSDVIDMSRCDFIGNSAVDLGTTGNTTGGGAYLYSYTSQALIDVRSCRFLGNVCDRSNGGGLTFDMSSDSPPLSGRVINSFFSGNRAGHGGGLYSQANLEVINSTFVGNAATAAPAEARGGAIYADETNEDYETPVVHNTIMWGNTSNGGTTQAAQFYATFAAVDINHSIFEGWNGNLGGVGNSGDDPLIIDPDGADDIMGTEDDEAYLSGYSPAIDQGDNGVVPADTSDLDNDGDTAELIPLDIFGQPRFHDDVDITGPGVEPNVDIGAFEFQLRSCPADLDENGILDLSDVTAFVTGFTALDPIADLNSNGLFDLFDIVLFVGFFNTGCP